MHTFQSHPLTSDQKLWLAEVAKTPYPFSPRAARVALQGLIASDFSPEGIDPRIYANKRLTPVGLWHVNSTHSLFSAIDSTIRAIRARIYKQPSLKSVTAAEIATDTGLTAQTVGEAFFAAGELRQHFFNKAIGLQGFPLAYSHIDLPDDDSIDDPYLNYTNINDLLEHFYIRRGEALQTTGNFGPSLLVGSTDTQNRSPLSITLDTNCLINLFDRQSSSATSVLELNTLILYSLSGKLKIFVTTRVEADMLKDPDLERRAQMLRTLEAFPVIGAIGRFGTSKWDSGDVFSEDQLNRLREEIQAIVFPGLQLSDRRYSNKINDVDHMIGHLLNHGSIFVTDDMDILQRAEPLRRGPGVVTMSPAQCAKYVDQLETRMAPQESNPFADREPVLDERAAVAVTQPAIAELPILPIEVFEFSRRMANSGDLFAWNQLREKGLTVSRQALLNWRATRSNKLSTDVSAARSWNFEILNTHASVIALAVAAAMSTDRRLTQQALLIDRVINPDGWEGSGTTTVVHAPESIGWAIHLLTGAALIYTSRMDAAFSLARSKVHVEGKPTMLVEAAPLTGWPPHAEKFQGRMGLHHRLEAKLAVAQNRLWR